MQSFSIWPTSSNKDAYDLSDAGFFYTGAVLYKQKPPYYKKKPPLIKKCVVKEKKTT
jgi:hypothetical protein